MMRALWTAASGMISQQTNVDVISNNLANVNTTGYKKERLEFKTLLYQTMSRANVNTEGGGQPVNLQVGLGVRPVATSRIFTTGNLERTDNTMDFAIDGDGFFVVERAGGEIGYSRDGNVKLSPYEGMYTFTTSEGYPYLDVDGEPITFPMDTVIDKLSVSPEGNFAYTLPDGTTEDTGIRFQLVQFPNRQGLEAVGQNLYFQTAASGEPMPEADGGVTRPSRIVQGVLEYSNVQIAEEMVKLIVAQRAYEINSKAITTSDEMLGIANSLKR